MARLEATERDEELDEEFDGVDDPSGLHFSSEPIASKNLPIRLLGSAEDPVVEEDAVNEGVEEIEQDEMIIDDEA